MFTTCPANMAEMLLSMRFSTWLFPERRVAGHFANRVVAEHYTQSPIDGPSRRRLRGDCAPVRHKAGTRPRNKGGTQEPPELQRHSPKCPGIWLFLPMGSISICWQNSIMAR